MRGGCPILSGGGAYSGGHTSTSGIFEIFLAKKFGNGDLAKCQGDLPPARTAPERQFNWGGGRSVSPFTPLNAVGVGVRTSPLFHQMGRVSCAVGCLPVANTPHPGSPLGPDPSQPSQISLENGRFHFFSPRRKLTGGCTTALPPSPPRGKCLPPSCP